MAKQLIITGGSSNDNTGDTLRNGAIKINSNFTELYEQNSLVFNRLNAGSNITLSKVGDNCTINAVVPPYTLPVSTSVILGGVKQGSNVTIAGDGTISVAAPYSLTATTTTTLGGVIIPVVGTSGITNTSGTIGLATASASQLGGVKVDGTTITIADGVISAAAGGGGGGGGGLEGTNFVLAQATGTPAENGTALLAAYQAAIAKKTPTQPISKLIIAPGNYDCTLDINSEYVDVVGLTNNPEDVNIMQGVTLSANNVRVVGIKSSTFTIEVAADQNSTNYTVERCTGGNGSFSSTLHNIYGSFYNCIGGDNSFNPGTGLTVGGRITECTANDSSFNYGSWSARYTRCTARGFSFYYGAGMFFDCYADMHSFSYGTGYYEHCYSYEGGFYQSSGKYINCKVSSIEGFNGISSGMFIGCTSGSSSFGTYQAISGTYIGCTAEDWSFGSEYGGSIGTTARLVNCVATNNSFGAGVDDYPTIAGVLINCVLTGTADNGLGRGYSTLITGGKLINCVSNRTLINI
jgi:hypothetical protein